MTWTELYEHLALDSRTDARAEEIRALAAAALVEEGPGGVVRFGPEPGHRAASEWALDQAQKIAHDARLRRAPGQAKRFRALLAEEGLATYTGRTMVHVRLATSAAAR